MAAADIRVDEGAAGDADHAFMGGDSCCGAGAGCLRVVGAALDIQLKIFSVAGADDVSLGGHRHIFQRHPGFTIGLGAGAGGAEQVQHSGGTVAAFVVDGNAAADQQAGRIGCLRRRDKHGAVVGAGMLIDDAAFFASTAVRQHHMRLADPEDAGPLIRCSCHRGAGIAVAAGDVMTVQVERDGIFFRPFSHELQGGVLRQLHVFQQLDRLAGLHDSHGVAQPYVALCADLRLRAATHHEAAIRQFIGDDAIGEKVFIRQAGKFAAADVDSRLIIGFFNGAFLRRIRERTTFDRNISSILDNYC